MQAPLQCNGCIFAFGAKLPDGCTTVMAPEGGEKEELRMGKGGKGGLTVCLNNRLSAGGTSRPTLIVRTLPAQLMNKMLKVPQSKIVIFASYTSANGNPF